jgi:hypothetical protein
VARDTLTISADASCRDAGRKVEDCLQIFLTLHCKKLQKIQITSNVETF